MPDDLRYTVVESAGGVPFQQTGYDNAMSSELRLMIAFQPKAFQ
jgi:hypothetical protein